MDEKKVNRTLYYIYINGDDVFEIGKIVKVKVTISAKDDGPNGLYPEEDGYFKKFSDAKKELDSFIKWGIATLTRNLEELRKTKSESCETFRIDETPGEQYGRFTKI